MHLLQPPHPFSQSHIWQLQRDYFLEEGIDAWRTGQVPHYLSSNPAVGKTYAELVLAFLRDLALKGQTQETVYLLELGAGHGRLCYHFLKHIEKFYESSAIPLPPFCYVLSDFTEEMLAFWRDHTRLQPYVKKGWVDFALFDVESSSEVSLRHKGISIETGALSQPLVVIANYFFDTIPQDLFLIQEGVIGNCLLSLSTEEEPELLPTAMLIDELELTYTFEVTELPIYPKEPILNTLLENYRQQLEHTHVLFPHIGIRCMERLRKLSTQGLLLLSADKGEHHLSNLDHQPPPQLATHGSFSLTVNFHALKAYCQQIGGLALFPLHQPASLDLGCMLFLNDAPIYRETQHAFLRFVNDFGPDDYFSLKKLVEKHFETYTYGDTMGVIRLSGYDARIFRQMLPRLHELIAEITDNEKWNLLLVIPRIWDTYFPLGEQVDLAEDLGDLLYALAFYREAVLYFEKSILIYGKDANIMYKIAVCHCLNETFDAAKPIIAELKALMPENEALQELIQSFAEELGEKNN